MRLGLGRRRPGGSHRWARVAVLALVAAVVPALVGSVSATFTASSAVAANSISAGVMFPQTVSTAAYYNYDAAAGSGETNTTSHITVADGNLWATHAWGSSFSGTRYIDFKYNSPLPTARTTTGVAFNVKFQSEYPGASLGCYYFEVRRASTSALLGTHGSSASPIACQDGTAFTTTSTALPEVTSSDIADDLMIRIYGKEASFYGFKFDLATVSGTADDAFTLQYWRIFDNAQNGNAATFDNPMVSDGDGVYRNASGWGTSFSGTQYLKWGFPTYVPSTAAVTGATFTHSFRAGGPGTACMYVEVYNGGTLLGTRGSASSPYCTNGTTTVRTDTFALTEVDTPAKAANLVVKMYVNHSSSTASDRFTQHDRATIGFTYGFR